MQDFFEDPADATPPTEGTISGKFVVLGMLAFGICTTALLFTYWTLHTAPFRDIQDAVVQRFPDSKPRVDGGRRKQQQELMLRITMQSPFDPTADRRRTESLLDELTEIAAGVRPLHDFDKIVLHLYYPLPEDRLIQSHHERAIAQKRRR